MKKLEKFMLIWLEIAFVFWLFFLIFIEFQSHLIAYYIWIPFGGVLFLFREKIKKIYNKCPWSAASKFIWSGIILIALQSPIAALANQEKFYAFFVHDFFIFIPWLIALYYILSRISFSNTEAYVLIGVHGIIFELVFSGVIVNPLSILIIPLTIFFYWIMVYPSMIVKEMYFKGRIVSKFKRYLIGLLIPLIAAIVFQIIYDTIRNFYPAFY